MLQKFHGLPDALAAFVEKRPIVCILIVIAYILSPIDILPEAFLGPIGLFDDALVGIAAVALLKRAAKARIAYRKANPPAPKPVVKAVERAPERPQERRPDLPNDRQHGGQDRGRHEGRGRDDRDRDRNRNRHRGHRGGRDRHSDPRRGERHP